MIREVDIGRKKNLCKFLDKAPDIRDLELRSRPYKICNGKKFFNRKDDNNNNNNNNGGNVFFLLSPPSPPRFDFQDETGLQLLPNIGNFLNDNVNNFPPPSPPPPTLPPFQQIFQPPSFQKEPDVAVRRKNDTATNTTQMMCRDCLIGELE